MKKVGFIAALCAIICGIAIYLYLGALEERVAEAEEEHAPEMTEVVVATQLIAPYEIITEDMLRTEEYPAEYVSMQAVRSVTEVVGLCSDGTLVEGQPLLTTMFGTAEDVGASLSYKIPDGMRAMSIPVTVDSGVGGYITRNDLVDVLLYLPVQEDMELNVTDGENVTTGGSIAKVALEAVMVLELGTGSYDSASGEIYTSITLALSPEDCLELLSYKAQSEGNGGSFYVTLRQRGDTSPTDEGTHSFAAYMNG